MKIQIIAKKVIDYFLQGLLFVAPIGLTIYVIFVMFNLMNGIAQDYLDVLLPFKIPGLGFLLLFIVITLTGFAGRTIIFKPVKIVLNKSLDKIPLIKVVYTSIRDFMSAFVGKEKKFTQPVLVKISKIYELEKIGFLTANDLKELGMKDRVAVYFPHSYAFSGELFIVAANLVQPLDINPTEAMKFIVSGGISKLGTKEENKETIPPMNLLMNE